MDCLIYPVSASEGDFQWKWRCKDGKRKSDRSFELFYDCVEDARSHGGDVDLEHVHLEIANAKSSVKIVAESARRS
jgi:hypothetical protein